MPELVNLGSLCIDYVYAVPSIVRAGETLVGTAPVRHPGGKGLNQSLAAVKAGARVAHIGCIGLDGTWLRELLSDAGVDVTGVRLREAHPTGHAMNQVCPHGENAIVIVGGANRTLEPADVDRAIARVGTRGWLLLQNEINDVEDILRAARSARVRVAFNIAPVDGESRYALDSVELLLLNEIEAAALAREADPQRALDRLTREHPQQHVVVTLGAHGVIYGRGSDRLDLPAFEVSAVDETGAGDAFIGHLMAAWIDHEIPVRERLRRACAAGALAVCLPGAADAIPDAGAVQRFLADYR